ncbi:permease [Candidatus Omnitrophota bacterium]
MLQLSVDWLVYSVFGMDPEARISGVINFFIYDSVKILLLLGLMISVIGFLRTFIPPQRIREWILKKKAFGNLFASLFGVITPFCSCSSIPIFMGFLGANVPLGVTFSFLITSPLVNEYLVVVMFGFFGWKITLLYVLCGVLIGVIAGMILGRMRLEKYISVDMRAASLWSGEADFTSMKQRVAFGLNEAKSIIKRLWIWILIAIGIGAVIHNFVPQQTIQGIIDRTGVFSVPLATLLGVPMYGSCVAIVPIAVVLFNKGVPLGAALAFMMATAALSLPEAIMLKRAMKLKLILIFFGITTIGIIFIGYLFNLLQRALI